MSSSALVSSSPSAESPATTSSIPSDLNFKSTLPPRKRAKTKEEKEQRRVERILRNRRAAHASREKKRKHVEYLESYVLKLETNLKSLTANFDSVHSLLSSHQVSELNLLTLENIDDLKQKIHQNLNSSAASFSNSNSPNHKRKSSSNHDDEDLEEEDDEDDDVDADAEDDSSSTTTLNTPVSQPPSKKVKLEQEGPTKLEINEPEIVVKHEHTDSGLVDDSTVAINGTENSNSYYNYLSPVSMNSPMNSPIDLTLSKQKHQYYQQQQFQFNHINSNTPTTATITKPSHFDSNMSLTSAYDMGQNSEVILSS